MESTIITETIDLYSYTSSLGYDWLLWDTDAKGDNGGCVRGDTCQFNAVSTVVVANISKSYLLKGY